MKKIMISIVMGSDSDLPVMKEAADTLKEFGISYEVIISSAHRTPAETEKFAKGALERGVKVIIAGAGLAAHLAGSIAANFPLPVIGIPLKGGALNGIDSLYSTVQMPPGIPVATVAINGAKNAALLAVQILAVDNKDLQKKLINYKNTLKESVIKKSKKLQELGLEKYLEGMKK
ncbi:MAG: 5-(carboxyamino)imidazole ribonucleotide mutase [Candidatus Roizmanbacteria bacterium]|nr:MAG: 5-(carboxyamino)imidazole ribonucleotide mutase [Candidatus Roizmanbacteria bacterium]